MAAPVSIHPTKITNLKKDNLATEHLVESKSANNPAAELEERFNSILSEVRENDNNRKMCQAILQFRLLADKYDKITAMYRLKKSLIKNI